MVVVGVLCLLAARARGHGSMVEPVPRNAIDRSLPKDQRSPPHTCDCANATGDACDVAQSCYWYSQGCTIGCPSCDHTNGRAQIDLCGLGMRLLLFAPKVRVRRRRVRPWRLRPAAAVLRHRLHGHGRPRRPAPDQGGKAATHKNVQQWLGCYSCAMT